MPHITAEFVTKVQPDKSKIVEYKDDRLTGFYIRVMPSGIKTFAVKCRIKGGSFVTYSIGKASQMPAAKARTRAAQIILAMKSGIDPRKVDREQQQADAEDRRILEAEEKSKMLTVRFVFADWKAKSVKTRDSSKYLYETSIHKHLKDWLDKPMTEITEDMVLKRYRVIRDDTVSGAATTIRALRRLYYWAKKEPDYKDERGHSIIKENPVANIQSNQDEWIKVKPRTWSIKDEKLQAWASAVAELDPTSRDFLMFLLLTGVRLSEASNLQWKNVDLNHRTFTVTDTKNGGDHTMPMGNAVYNQLLGRYRTKGQNVYVFPARVGKGARPKTDPRLALQKVQQYLKERDLIVDSDDYKNYTPHALRRTFAKVAGSILPLPKVKALLNHQSSNDVTLHHYVQVNAAELHEDITRIEEYLFKWINKPIADANTRPSKVLSLV